MKRARLESEHPAQWHPRPLTQDSANDLCQYSGMYDRRCGLYRSLGMTRSDAQAVVDAEIIRAMKQS